VFTLEEAACFPYLKESKMLLESLDLDLSYSSPRFRPLLELTKRRLVEMVDSMPSRCEGPPWLELAAFHMIFAVLKFSRNQHLRRLFAQREARNAAIRFLSSHSKSLRLKVATELCGPVIFDDRLVAGGNIFSVKMPVWGYLACLRKQELKKLKLVNRPVTAGFVYLQDQELAVLIEEGVRSLIESKFEERDVLFAPSSLKPLISWVDAEGPHLSKPIQGSSYGLLQYSKDDQEPFGSSELHYRVRGKRPGYEYIEKLLQKPVSDGRHRLVWLVITPYLVNVRKLGLEEAVRATIQYLKKCGWSDRRLESLADYHTRRAYRVGLRPPRLETLARKDPHPYNIIRNAQT
jgi:hypothetical protein